jgi:hypothetical protein
MATSLILNPKSNMHLFLPVQKTGGQLKQVKGDWVSHRVCHEREYDHLR